MKPHEERVVAEEKDLSDKLNKLGVFIAGEPFQALDFEDRRLLQEQQIYMTKYASVLRQRIARFGN